MDETCNFYIHGVYDSSSKRFWFHVQVDNSTCTAEHQQFLDGMIKHLSIKRTLEQTVAFIEGMLHHNDTEVQAIGRIMQRAADSTWADCFLQESLAGV